ncbi:sensor histidine kinase [Chitinophaga solisilvae]|uniref:Histidine kinase n=1 Tax=Chitinophaga solisilvae TaxID=1233460 RepID=A0A9Q5D7N6_9BACT|nr:histidine kinase [Chitinophaga solisilvae]NSL85967.1 histidine kinase [Chitinophaga solisilvae]
MNFQENEKLFSSKVFLYLSRILILYTFSIIFQSFDHTFVQELKMLNFRGQMFSLVYVLFGLLVWEGTVRLTKFLEHRLHNQHTTRRLSVLCAALLVYGMLSAYCFGFLYGAMDIVLFHRYEAWESFRNFSYDLNFGIFCFYLLILAFNGIVYYYSGWKESQVQAERLMRENLQAKYDALRNQIDPHFFFNSLSVLTNLVYKSPDLSADYITQLAKTYRYILDKKFENLVTVQTELDFLDSYLFLMRIRHQQSVQFRVNIDEKTRMKGMIPPVSLQLLIENAIKHNRFSHNDPLIVTVEMEEGHLVVSNPVRLKTNPDMSSGIGLENIRNRYALISDRSIIILQQDDQFIVKIPIIATT